MRRYDVMTRFDFMTRFDYLADLIALEVAFQNWRGSILNRTGRCIRERENSRHLFLLSLVQQSRFLK